MKRTALPLLFALVTPLLAQDTDLTKRRLAKLRQCLDRMANAERLSFRSSLQKTDTLMLLRMNARGGQAKAAPPTKTTGMVVGDVLLHRCNAGKDEVVVRGRRRIARSGGAWTIASQRLGDNKPSPFLVDPQQFFASLAVGGGTLAKHTVGMIGNKPVEIYTLRFEGKAADSLGLAGAYPDGINNVARSATIAMAAGGAMLARPVARNRPVLKIGIDVALFVEPGRGTVLQAKLRAYKDAPNAARIRQMLLRRGGQQQQEEVEEEDEADAKSKPLVYKDGLPVRKTDDKQVTSFDLEFVVGGEQALPDLDANAKKLLGIGK